MKNRMYKAFRADNGQTIIGQSVVELTNARTGLTASFMVPRSTTAQMEVTDHGNIRAMYDTLLVRVLPETVQEIAD